MVANIGSLVVLWGFVYGGRILVAGVTSKLVEGKIEAVLPLLALIVVQLRVPLTRLTDSEC